MWLRPLGLAMVVAIAMGLGPAALAQQAVIPEVARANQLMAEGKPADAFALLDPLEDKYSGDVDFDYALGTAALDSGKADRATLALERVLSINPDHAGARLDMARAYFQLGDSGRAKTEFQAVQSQNPPPTAVAVIDRYLEAIDEIERAKKRSLRSYVEATIGYDGNVNNSGTTSQIPIPALGNLVFTLSPTNIKRSDAFKTVGAGVDFTYQVQPEFGLFAGADGRKRANTNEDTFDNGSMDLRTGVILGQTANQVRVSINGGRYSLDNALSRRTEGGSIDWRYTLDPVSQFSAFSQYSRSRFTSLATQVNSFNSTTSGAGYLHVLNDGKAAVFGTAFLGKERDIEGRADGNKAFYGLRLGGQIMLADNLDMFGVLSSTIGHYGRTNATFLSMRHDEQTDFVVGATWRFAREWSLRPQLVHTRNTSTIVIYQYERTEGSVTLRRDF